jgi:hypothetical protein
MSLAALEQFFAHADSTQREKLDGLVADWQARLGALDADELVSCLRLIQKKINSKKLIARRDELIGALRRDGLPAGAKIPKPVQPVPELPVVDSSGRDPNSYNPELDALIAADPLSKDSRLIYRDWLEEQGLVEDGRVKLGAIAEHEGVLSDDVWRSGFLIACTLKVPAETPFELARAVDLLLNSPGAGRFVEELTLGLAQFDDNHYKDACDAIGSASRYALQKLYIGDYGYEECELNWSSIDAQAMWGALPRLRELTLRAGSMKLGDIELPELRKFETITGGLDHEAALSIANAKWPNIESLDLQYGLGRQGATASIDVVRPILDSQHMPELRMLGITNCEFTDELCEILPTSRLLPQLEELDLCMGTMGAEGARSLIRNRERFAHLKRLNLDDNYVPPALTAALASICPEVIIGDQRDDGGDPGNRYASAYE